MWLNELKNSDRGTGGVRALASEYERMVRICAIVEKTIFPLAPALPRLAGLGTYLNYLNKISASPECPECAKTINSEMNSVRILNKDGINFGDLRNYLAHGGIEPTDPQTAQSLEKLLDKNWDLLERFVTEQGVAIDFQGIIVNNRLCSKLIFEDNCGVIFYFQEAQKRELIYYSSDGRGKPFIVNIDVNDKLCPAKMIVSTKSTPESKNLDHFYNDIMEDLKAFQENETEIRQIELPEKRIGVEWDRALSDGAEHRLDIFYIQKSHARRWELADGDFEYADFLKFLVNWNISITRLKYRIEELSRFKANEDLDDFAVGSELIIPEEVKPAFRLLDPPPNDGGTRDVKHNNYDFTRSLDRTSTAQTGKPQIYFVSGEAGVGKTYNLIKIAEERLEQLAESNPGEKYFEGPAYLYVSCSGSGYKGLKQIINNEIIETRNLTFDSASALIRAGLLVIIVDGFDELISDAGYNDALEVLDPILRKIGTHGTLVISARSAYQANQYQESLKRNDTLLGPIDHHFVELNRWSLPDINTIFDANPEWVPFLNMNVNEKSLLGIPYFAKSFHLYASTFFEENSKHGNEQAQDYAIDADLRGLLIDEYLKREVKKISTDDRLKFTVNADMLRTVYSEIAGLMLEQETRHLDFTDFQLACETALNLTEPDGRHAALLSRLTVLCGMSVSYSPADPEERAFSFSHEVFYEYFIGKNLETEIKRQSADRLASRLASQLLGEGTVGVLADTISHLEGKLISTLDCRDSNSILKKNISAVFASAINKGIPFSSQHFYGLEFSTLHFGEALGRNLTFAECDFQELELWAEPGTGSLTFINCRFQKITVHGSDGKRFRMENVSIGDLVHFEGRGGPVWLSSRIDIFRKLDALQILGAKETVIDIESTLESEKVEFAKRVLGRFMIRKDNVYVVEQGSRTPGDGASGWMPEPDSYKWADLTNALLNNDLAEEKEFNSSGASKSRIVFRRPVQEILEPSEADVDVKRFWDSLK